LNQEVNEYNTQKANFIKENAMVVKLAKKILDVSTAQTQMDTIWTATKDDYNEQLADTITALNATEFAMNAIRTSYSASDNHKQQCLDTCRNQCVDHVNQMTEDDFRNSYGVDATRDAKSSSACAGENKTCTGGCDAFSEDTSGKGKTIMAFMETIRLDFQNTKQQTEFNLAQSNAPEGTPGKPDYKAGSPAWEYNHASTENTVLLAQYNTQKTVAEGRRNAALTLKNSAASNIGMRKEDVDQPLNVVMAQIERDMRVCTQPQTEESESPACKPAGRLGALFSSKQIEALEIKKCDKVVTHAERQRQRKAEIASLKDALEIIRDASDRVGSAGI